MRSWPGCSGFQELSAIGLSSHKRIRSFSLLAQRKRTIRLRQRLWRDKKERAPCPSVLRTPLRFSTGPGAQKLPAFAYASAAQTVCAPNRPVLRCSASGQRGSRQCTDTFCYAPETDNREASTLRSESLLQLKPYYRTSFQVGTSSFAREGASQTPNVDECR